MDNLYVIDYNYVMKKHLAKLINLKTYWQELLLLLLIKAILLAGLYYYCFKDPLILSDQTAGAHILH